MPRRNFTKELWEATEKELRACGLPRQKEAIEFCKAVVQGRTPKPMRALAKTAIGSALLAGFQYQVKKAAARIRNEKQLSRALEEIDGLRYRLRPLFADAHEKVAKMLPPKKRGPQSRLTDREKQDACSTISTFIRNGSTAKYAIEIMARERHVSTRLMRKIWQQKGQ